MKSLRLKVHEVDAAKIKTFEINKVREEKGLTSITESALMHEMIRQAIPKAQIDDYGNIVIGS